MRIRQLRNIFTKAPKESVDFAMVIFLGVAGTVISLILLTAFITKG